MATRSVVSQDAKIEGEARFVADTFDGTLEIILKLGENQNLGNIQHTKERFGEVSILQMRAVLVSPFKVFCLN